MKEYNLFRGIPIGGKKDQWIYGSFHKYLPYTPAIDQEPKEDEYQYLIIQDGFSDWNMPRKLRVIQVYPESVGVYSGIRDEHGVKIFEGDSVRCQPRIMMVTIEKTIEYYDGFFWATGKDGEPMISLLDLLKRYCIESTSHCAFDQYWNEENECYIVTNK